MENENETKKLIKKYNELVKGIKKDLNKNENPISINDNSVVYNFLLNKLSAIKDYSAKFNDFAEKFSEKREDEEVEIYSLSTKISVLEKYSKADMIDVNALNFARLRKELYSELENSAKSIFNSLKTVYSELEEKLNNNEIKKGLEIISSISGEYDENK